MQSISVEKFYNELVTVEIKQHHLINHLLCKTFQFQLITYCSCFEIKIECPHTTQRIGEKETLVIVTPC